MVTNQPNHCFIISFENKKPGKRERSLALSVSSAWRFEAQAEAEAALGRSLGGTPTHRPGGGELQPLPRYYVIVVTSIQRERRVLGHHVHTQTRP
jgi:hypothetical protein